MRTLNDLSPDERSAYGIWMSKLKDRTLSVLQHDECRREIDKILWKGPNEQIHQMKHELATLTDRITRLEFHAGLNDEPVALTVTPPRAPDRTGLKQEVTASVAKKDHPPTVDPPESAGKQETRGRKPLRYSVEKNEDRQWVIRDGHFDTITGYGPYKTRKEAKEMTDELNTAVNITKAFNAGAECDPPEPPKVYHDGDGVIRTVGDGPSVGAISPTPSSDIGPDPADEDPLA